ncbi:MAG: hypothetical protein ACXVFH_12765 [Solirubrobacteraceae bacterium]
MTDLRASFPLAALTHSRTLFELRLVTVLAAAAPLIARLLRLPSILLLLALGFGAGAAGALDPNALLGPQLISAVVSVAVGIILFEAGLDLKLSKLTGDVARVYRRLVSVGILATWRSDRRRPAVLRSLLGGRTGARGGAGRLRPYGRRAAARVHPSLEEGRPRLEVGRHANRPDRTSRRSLRDIRHQMPCTGTGLIAGDFARVRVFRTSV